LVLEYFVGRYAMKAGKNINHINRKALALFKGYAWPGNIRELQNMVERGVILSEEDTFLVDESWFKRPPTASWNGRNDLPELAQRKVEMIGTSTGCPQEAQAPLKIERKSDGGNNNHLADRPNLIGRSR
jgi:formate hydrogenlyase transcriptional activator